eukprot:TRINITY_DN1526_c1_g1_i1.p2 TRINITY_DN1526_c1_g1~~TRINITY_DN1526_c1_g1_i1.p2  ORF type:complete len:354 (+),score=85.91 TRINITY_DN1526_c1_g1_i1:551-1612(+)
MGGLPRGQRRLHHLVLAADQEWELLPGAADRLVALCWALCPHLHSLDLSVLATALGLGTEGAFVRLFDRLPVLPAVRLVHTGSTSSMSERMLAAVARVCPAVETLCCMGLLAPELDSAAGAAVLLRLLPHLRRLSCIQNYGYDDVSVSTEFVAALCGGRRLDSLAIVAAGTGGDHGGLPKALLGVDAPPEGLRHTGYLDEVQVAALAIGGLPGLRRLHLAAVALDKAACRALSRLTDLRSLFLGIPNDGPLALEAASVLAPPPSATCASRGLFGGRRRHGPRDRPLPRVPANGAGVVPAAVFGVRRGGAGGRDAPALPAAAGRGRPLAADAGGGDCGGRVAARVGRPHLPASR